MVVEDYFLFTIGCIVFCSFQMSRTKSIHYLIHFLLFSNPFIFQIQNPAPFKFDAKVLPVPPYSVDKMLKMSVRDQEKHLAALCEALGHTEKGPPSQKRLHLMNYTAVLGANPAFATIMTRLGALNTLAKQFKDTPQVDV